MKERVNFVKVSGIRYPFFLICFKDVLPFFQNLVFKDQLSYWIRSSSETY